jgi:hypothetical protein
MISDGKPASQGSLGEQIPTMNEEANHLSQDISDIEVQLRRLPAPEPSPEFQRRLLAGISESPVVSASSHRRAPWIVALATAAAAVMVAAGLGLLFHRRAGSTPNLARRPASSSKDATVVLASSSGDRLNNTSPELILGTTMPRLLAGTKPCDILPPSPYD